MLCIRSDHGTEFKDEVDVWCVANGVIGNTATFTRLSTTVEQNVLSEMRLKAHERLCFGVIAL